jgi:hypothetical protein
MDDVLAEFKGKMPSKQSRFVPRSKKKKKKAFVPRNNKKKKTNIVSRPYQPRRMEPISSSSSSSSSSDSEKDREAIRRIENVVNNKLMTTFNSFNTAPEPKKKKKNKRVSNGLSSPSSSSSSVDSEEERTEKQVIESLFHNKFLKSFKTFDQPKPEAERELTESEAEAERIKANEWKEALENAEHDMVIKLQQQQELRYLRTNGSVIKKQDQIDLENELEKQEVERTAMQNTYDEDEEAVLQQMKGLSITGLTQETYEDIKHWLSDSKIEREYVTDQWVEKYLSLHEECGTREELLYILKECQLI